MSEAAIRAQIKANLEGVSGIGVVHDYERFSRSWAQFLTLMTASGAVNGWMIHREANANSRQVGGRIERYHTYRIFGIYEMDDASASEVTFQALLELIYAAFIDDPRLLCGYGTNLCPDGSMEAGSNWTNHGTPTTNERSSEQAHDGTYSRKFVSDAAADGIISGYFPTSTGKTYRVSAWVYPDDATRVDTMVRNGAAAGAICTISHTGLMQDTWNYVEFVYTETNGGIYAVLIFYDAAGDTGTWYIDEVEIHEGLVINGGFEIGGTGDDFDGGAEVDDGTSDTFTGWTNAGVDDGAGDKIEATATAKTQNYAVKIINTTTAVLRIKQDFAVIPGKTYQLSFWTRGDGSVGGRYGLTDLSNSVAIISTTSTGVTGTTYTEVTMVFVAPAGCVSIRLNLWASATAGTVYFDCAHVQEIISATAAGTEPIQIESIDADEFGGRLYHTAELVLEVMERITS